MDSAVQTVTSLTSRVRAEPSFCLPLRPAVSLLRTGTPVPSTPRYIVGAGARCGGPARSRSSAAIFSPKASAVRSTCWVPTRTPAKSSSRPLACSKLTRAAAAPVMRVTPGDRIGVRHAQGAVAREEALAASGTVIVGSFQSELAHAGHEGLGAAPGVARWLAAGAWQEGAGAVASVGVEALLDGLCRHFQRALAEAGLQRLEVDRVGAAGSYETGEFGFDGGGELLRAGFFSRAGGTAALAGQAGVGQLLADLEEFGGQAPEAVVLVELGLDGGSGGSGDGGTARQTGGWTGGESPLEQRRSQFMLLRESCAGCREAVGEALTAARVGRALSIVNLVRSAEAVSLVEGNTDCTAMGETQANAYVDDPTKRFSARRAKLREVLAGTPAVRESEQLVSCLTYEQCISEIWLAAIETDPA